MVASIIRMTSHPCGMLFFLATLSSIVVSTQQHNDTAAELGEARWAVLVAGSSGYENYRHQADVCHAYQILKKGGLKDENIIVFMYDDIAFNKNNPRPGIIINRPNGEDVYHGVPKDYTGKNATLHNLFSVILGNQSAVVGGSGKVLDSGPNDRIFIYYVDHGSPGIVGMPSGEDLYAKDLIEVLKRKHKRKAYKSMVFYLEACESGSMFEGLLSPNLNIYAVTAANASENSWAISCPGDWPRPSEEYSTCLGDLFSVAWMEDSDLHDLRQETLEKQYKVVRRRTWMDNLEHSSHVMQYGDMQFQMHSVSTYLGSNPQNDNYTFTPFSTTAFTPRATNQRDASLLHFWHKLQSAPEGSNHKVEAHKKLQAIISHRRHVDETMHLITKTSFGEDKVSELMNQVRHSGQPLVDNWSCLKKFVGIYERHCGVLSWYGKKYARALANMCNAGISVEEMTMASTQACNKRRFPSANDSEEYVLDK